MFKDDAAAKQRMFGARDLLYIRQGPERVRRIPRTSSAHLETRSVSTRTSVPRRCGDWWTSGEPGLTALPSDMRLARKTPAIHDQVRRLRKDFRLKRLEHHLV